MKNNKISRLFAAAVFAPLLMFTGCMDLYDDEEVKLTITYESGYDSTVLKSETYIYGADVALDFLNKPVRDGYTFTGWYEPVSNISYAVPSAESEAKSIILTKNITLRAEWLENALEGSGINIVWDDEYNDIELFSCVVSGDKGNIVTFTSKTDHEKYSWWLSNKTDVQSTDKSFVWNTDGEKTGTYYVTLVVSDGTDSRASSMIVVVNK